MSQEIKRTFKKLPSSRKVPDEIKAIIGKLGRDPHGNAGQKVSRNIQIPDQRVLGHIANKTVNNINDARNLFQVLPDMDYARQIVISATISPGDLTDCRVIYSCENEELDSNLTGPLLRELQGFYDNTYRITKLLQPILNDVLFEKGSYPLLMLPESSIDQIINNDDYRGATMESQSVSLESYLQNEVGTDGTYMPYGLLGFPKRQGMNALHSSFESFATTGDYAAHSYIDFPSMESHDKDRKHLVEAMNLISAGRKNTFMVTDNPSILKHPMIMESKRKLAVKRVYGNKLKTGRRGHGTPQIPSRAAEMQAVRYDGKNAIVSNEARNDKMQSLAQTETAFYSERRFKHIPVQPLLTKSQVGAKTYGHPLVMHLPAESVIPIHVPGNPAEHVGYYVLLDINGNPLNVTAHDNYYDDIRGQLGNNDQFSSQVLTTVRRGVEGLNSVSNEIIDEMTRISGQAVEADLLARLRSGAAGGEYAISRPQHITQLMFSRQLKGQKTIMLYVPVELMTYIAFDYNEFGVGKSLLEDGKILGSIRAALMLSNTLATINNATGGKTIEITLDEKDENPAETVEFLMTEYAKVNSDGYARMIGQTHPLGLADQIQNHGVNVVVSGNSRYPATKFDVNQRQGVNTPIDPELEKTMRDRHFQLFGLSPEVADGINSADFATTVVQNNLMLLKRVIRNQEQLEPFLTDLVRNYTLNSGILMDLLTSIVEENKKYLDGDYKGNDGAEQFLHDFILSVKAELPSPEINDTTKQLEAFKAYSESLDEMLNAYFNSDMFLTDTTDGMQDIIEPVRNNVKAEFQRRWLRKRGVMSELDVFNTVEEDDSPAFNFMEISSNHMDGLVKSLMKYMNKALKAQKKRQGEKQKIEDLKAEIEKLGPGLQPGDTDTPDLNLDSGDDLGGDGGDDFGMGGDDGLGGGDDGLGDLGDAGETGDGSGDTDSISNDFSLDGGETGGDGTGDAGVDALSGTDATADGSGDELNINEAGEDGNEETLDAETTDGDAEAIAEETPADDTQVEETTDAVDDTVDTTAEEPETQEGEEEKPEEEEEEQEPEEEEEPEVKDDDKLKDSEQVDETAIDIPDPKTADPKKEGDEIDIPKAPK